MLTNFLGVLLFTCIPVFCNEADPKIIDGYKTTIEQHPYLASIRYYDNHICSGVIVNEESIITSLQCVTDNKLEKRYITISVGATKHSEGQIFTIMNLVGSSNTDSKENDIAILKLATKLTYSDKINKIELHGKNKIPDGTIAQVIGWGVINDADNEVSDVLHKSEETIISYMDCNIKYGINMISHDMICAKNNGKGICRGDIGGPFILNNKLIGIASWNYGCNNIYPDVFASTVFLYDWIIANI